MSGQHPGTGSGSAPESAPGAATAPAPVNTPLAAGQSAAGRLDAGESDGRAGRRTLRRRAARRRGLTAGSRQPALPPAGARRPRRRRFLRRPRPGACPGRSRRHLLPQLAGARREHSPNQPPRPSRGPLGAGSPSPGPQQSWRSAPGWGSTPSRQVQRQPMERRSARRAVRPADKAPGGQGFAPGMPGSAQDGSAGGGMPGQGGPDDFAAGGMAAWAAGFPPRCMPSTWCCRGVSTPPWPSRWAP